MVTVNINQPCADRLNGAGVELTAALADNAAAVQIGGYARSTGIPCQAPVVKGRKRCKMRGKLSTGPKTAAGRKRISEAQRIRWQATVRGCDPDHSR